MCLRLKGCVPDSASNPVAIAALQSFEPVSSALSLRGRHEMSGRRVVCVFVGMGDARGFRRSSQSYLPDDWWDCQGGSIHLFAGACHSAAYLRSGQIVSFVGESIGFEGDVAFCFPTSENRSDRAIIEFWEFFAERLVSLLDAKGRIDAHVFVQIKSLYEELVTGRYSGSYSGRAHHHYLVRLSLTEQLNGLRHLPGGRLGPMAGAVP